MGGLLMALVAYTDQQRSEAVAVVLATPTQNDAVEFLAQLWPDIKPPGRSTLSLWSRDVSIEPDADVLAAIDRERKAAVRARIHSLHRQIGEKFERELSEMNWTSVQKGAIALGIFTDKLLGTRQGGDVKLELNDNRGADQRSVSFTFGPKEDMTPALPEEAESAKAHGTDL